MRRQNAGASSTALLPETNAPAANNLWICCNDASANQMECARVGGHPVTGVSNTDEKVTPARDKPIFTQHLTRLSCCCASRLCHLRCRSGPTLERKAAKYEHRRKNPNTAVAEIHPSIECPPPATCTEINTLETSTAPSKPDTFLKTSNEGAKKIKTS